MDKEDFKYALPVGSLLRSPNREYRIEKVLGVGGFGITYKVSATLVYQNVPIFTYFAVKEHFLKDACERDAGSAGVVYSRPSKARVEESRKDFLSEAERLNALSGQVDNIVPVSEVFEANNTVYYVMEYLNGGSLSDIVKAGGPLPEQRALEIIEPVARAVAFLHSHRINHLDIKPDNIMFKTTPDGSKIPVIIDFGLAKHYDGNGRPTSTVRVQGCSDGYAPVEQYAGLNTFVPQAMSTLSAPRSITCLWARIRQSPLSRLRRALCSRCPRRWTDRWSTPLSGRCSRTVPTERLRWRLFSRLFTMAAKPFARWMPTLRRLA